MRRRWATPLLAVALVAASTPVLRRESARARDRRVLRTLLTAELVKLGAALAAQQLIDRRFADTADAHDYHRAGVEIAPRLRTGDLAGAAHLARVAPWDTRYRAPVGTNFARLFAGGAYAVVGPSKTRGFLLSSWVGFWGLYCFYRAFALAVPGGRSLTYARLLYGSPSILFWTSSLGKEAWTTLGLGAGALGAAHLSVGNRRRGAQIGMAGLAVTLLVRPQLTVYLGLDGVNDDRPRETGSWFEPPEPTLRNLPRLAWGVLFRPHVWEARNVPAAAAALEGAAVVAFSAARWRWMAEALRSMRDRPYVAFALASLAGSIAVLSRLRNLGLLARERSPVLPLYFVLLSIPPPGR